VQQKKSMWIANLLEDLQTVLLEQPQQKKSMWIANARHESDRVLDDTSGVC